MDRILIGLIFCSFLVSCNNRTSTENHASNQSTIDNKRGIKLSEKLYGLWISDSYLKNIEKNKSIYLSRKYNTKIQGFYLDKKTLLTDSAFLEGFTDHEGGYRIPIKYDELNDKFITDMPRLSDYPSFPGLFELNYDGNKNIEMYFPKSKITDKYRKVNSDFQTEIRKILIAGDYKPIYDNSRIRLDSDGKIHNFQDFQFYELIYDFGEGIEYDAIVFFKSLKGGNWSDGEIYKFEFVSNSLHLQHVKTNWETMEHEIDDIILVLERE